MQSEPQSAPLRAQRGFSLIELVLTIVLLGIVGAVGTQMLDGGVRAYFASADAANLDWQGRIALERMTRDILRIRSATPGDLTISPATQLTMTDYNGNAVNYSLSGATLVRNADPLADGVSGLNFSYLMSDGTSVAIAATDVYYITVAFTVTRNNLSRTMRATLQPRNLR